MIRFTEHDDRFESIMIVGSDEVTIAVDKPISDQELTSLGDLMSRRATTLVQQSISYIDLHKEERGIGYIDDLSDPQILAGPEFVSVYWSSAKGESRGEAILGVDFDASGLKPVGLTIGD